MRLSRGRGCTLIGEDIRRVLIKQGEAARMILASGGSPAGVLVGGKAERLVGALPTTHPTVVPTVLGSACADSSLAASPLTRALDSLCPDSLKFFLGDLNRLEWTLRNLR